MKCKIYRINKENPLPAPAKTGDAGHDCYASMDIVFNPAEIKLIPLGIIAKSPEDYHFKLFIRSSGPKKRGFMLANGVGIIDSSFCGEKDEICALIKAPETDKLFKFDEIYETFYGNQIKKHGWIIKKGERICQLMLEKNIEIEWEEQENRDFVKESRGGFGSSGQT